MNKKFSLSDLIAPVSVDDFKRDFYQQFPLYLPRQEPGFFTGLLSKDEIISYFQRNDFRYPNNISLYKDGNAVDSALYTYDIVAAGTTQKVVDTRKVFYQFSQGATILMGGVEFCIDSMRDFCSSIVSNLRCNTSITGLYTPANSRGFQPHFDNVDVFVFQLYGTKKWKIYADPHHYAVHNADCDVKDSELFLDVELNPGDTLYVPRGYVHDVHCTENESFHLTLGLAPTTWIDVVDYVLLDKKRLVGFRAPVDIDGLNEMAVRYRLSTLFNKILDDISVTEIKGFLNAKIDRHLEVFNNDYLDHLESNLK